MQGNRKDRLNTDTLSLIPLVAALGIVPLVVHLRIIPYSAPISSLFPRSAADTDFFSYYKSLSLTVLGMASLLLLIVRIALNQVGKKHLAGKDEQADNPLVRRFVFLSVSVFAVCTIGSTILSEYRTVAITGFPGRYEGMFVLLSYLILFLGAYLMVSDTRKAKPLMVCLIISSSLICLIGLFQFVGMDLFQTELVQKLVMSGFPDGKPAALDFANNADIGYKNVVYGTLFNSNTFGMYISMLFPFSLCLALVVKGKKLLLPLVLYSGLMLFCLLGSYSRGAYAGAATGTILVLAVVLWKKLTDWKRVTATVSFLAMLTVFMFFLSGGIVGQRLGSILAWTDSGIGYSTGSTPADKTDKIRDILLEDGKLTLYTGFTELNASIGQKGLSFTDKNGNILDLIPSGDDNNTYTFVDTKFTGYTIQVSENILNVMKDKSFLLFGMENGKFLPLDANGRVMQLTEAEHFGFEGMERFASARGYIWSRTIPLLKNTILLGYGPDTFAMYFPQNDYLGKLNFMYDANILVDKPHSIYLQTAVNTGVVSLLSILSLLFLFFLSCIQSILKWKVPDKPMNYGFVFSAAVPGYLVSGFFTDSTICTAPIFWILLGAAIGLNQITAKDTGRDSVLMDD